MPKAFAPEDFYTMGLYHHKPFTPRALFTMQNAIGILPLEDADPAQPCNAKHKKDTMILRNHMIQWC